MQYNLALSAAIQALQLQHRAVLIQIDLQIAGIHPEEHIAHELGIQRVSERQLDGEGFSGHNHLRRGLTVSDQHDWLCGRRFRAAGVGWLRRHIGNVDIDGEDRFDGCIV